MNQIEELQSRITAAVERIGKGIAELSTQPPVEVPVEIAPAETPEPDPDLVAALEDERLANAQLEERVKRLKARHAEELEQAAGAGDAKDQHVEEIAALKAELEALKAEAGRVGELEAALSEAKARAEAGETLQAELEAAQARLADTSEVEALRADLAEAQAQLAEKSELETLRAELNGDVSGAETDHLRADLETLKAEYQVQTEAMAALDHDLQRLRLSNDQLREVITALREANAGGVGDPSLINKAMLAELEGLRATRATDMAEAGAVLAKLEPLLAQAANLPEGEVE